MKKMSIPTLILFVLVLLALACSNSAPVAEVADTATPDTQATVDAAIAATSVAQANMQATVDAAIAATAIMMPPTPTPGPELEYVTMTEEELAALIDEAVAEAVTASDQASAATTQSTSDGTITTEEVDTMEVYVYGAEEAIAYAEELIQIYYSLYGDLATETLELLIAVEDDLSEMASYMAELTSILLEVEDALLQGLELAEDTINQLENVAQTVLENLSETQAQVQDWMTKAGESREQRAEAISQIQANNIPNNLVETLQGAFSFIDTVRESLLDNKLTRDELNQIAQLGANVSAGLNAHGGERFSGLAGKVNEITGQLARGDVPKARSGLGEFEAGLGDRPSGPGFDPDLPGRPSSGLPGRP